MSPLCAHDRGYSSTGILDFLAEPAIRRTEAAERACDAAAEKLNELVVGLPRCHPLLKDADKRLDALKASLDRLGTNFRRPTWRESQTLDLRFWSPTFMPNISSLGRAATAEDVKAGKAVFHLEGKGKPAELKLPAVAMLKADERKERPARLLIVQAEIGPDGTALHCRTRRSTAWSPDQARHPQGRGGC